MDDYNITLTFIDDEADPKQTSTMGRSAFLRTFIPVVDE